MTASDGKAWVLRALIVALPCSVLSCLVTLWVVNPSSRDSSLPGSEVDTEALVERLDELGQKMDAMLRYAETIRTAPTVERQPILEGESMAEEMSEILDRLESLQAILEASGRIQNPIQRDVPITRNAKEPLDQVFWRDPEAARKPTMLRTPEDVITRFGVPSSQGNRNDARFEFVYRRAGPNGEDNSATFFFVDGKLASYKITQSR